MDAHAIADTQHAPCDREAVEENARQSHEIIQAAVLQATVVGQRMQQEQLDASEDELLLSQGGDSVLDVRTRKQRSAVVLVLWAMPTAFSVWYAAAIFFVPSAHMAAPALLWTPGATTWLNGTLTCCPKPALCSEGWAQFWLLVAARLSAFAMYPSLLLIFFSKCHASLRFLSRSFVAELLPFAHLHSMHTVQGAILAGLALFHTLVHLVRWGLRGELATYCGRWAGMSGLFGTALMLATTCSMLLPRLRRCGGRRGGRLTALLAAVGNAPFERRFRVHYLFVPLALVLCYHAPRLMTLTLVAACVWTSDYTYQLICCTYRLDVVEFTRLVDGGVQVLWTNPPGFRPNSGEFVKVLIPWLPGRWGSQWHPFSLYLREATAKGLMVAGSPVSSVQQQVSERDRVFCGREAKGGYDMVPGKTALLMIEFQNEVPNPTIELGTFGNNTARTLMLL